MGQFEIKTQRNNATYEYTGDSLIVQGNFVKDATTNNLVSINGSCYNKNQQGELGEYIGNFNGYMRDNQIRYTMSEMSRRDSNKVWDAIDEIETNIIGNGEAE